MTARMLAATATAMATAVTRNRHVVVVSTSVDVRLGWIWAAMSAQRRRRSISSVSTVAVRIVVRHDLAEVCSVMSVPTTVQVPHLLLSGAESGRKRAEMHSLGQVAAKASSTASYVFRPLWLAYALHKRAKLFAFALKIGQGVQAVFSVGTLRAMILRGLRGR